MLSILQCWLSKGPDQTEQMLRLMYALISSPELFRRLSVRSLTFSKDFSSETAEPVLRKFHVEPSSIGGTKDC